MRVCNELESSVKHEVISFNSTGPTVRCLTEAHSKGKANPMADTQKTKEKESKYTTTESHQITKVRAKRNEKIARKQ